MFGGPKIRVCEATVDDMKKNYISSVKDLKKGFNQVCLLVGCIVKEVALDKNQKDICSATRSALKQQLYWVELSEMQRRYPSISAADADEDQEMPDAVELEKLKDTPLQSTKIDQKDRGPDESENAEDVLREAIEMEKSIVAIECKFFDELIGKSAIQVEDPRMEVDAADEKPAEEVTENSEHEGKQLEAKKQKQKLKAKTKSQLHRHRR